MSGIGNRESVNALLAVGDKRSSVKNLSCKRIENTGMLLVLSVGLNINSMSSDPYKAVLGILYIVCQTFLKLDKRDFLSLLAYNFSLIKRNFKSVCTGVISSRGDENARCSVRILGINRNVVLNLDIMPLALVAECTDF